MVPLWGSLWGSYGFQNVLGIYGATQKHEKMLAFLWFSYGLQKGLGISGHPETRENHSFSHGFPMGFRGFCAFAGAQKPVETLACSMGFLLFSNSFGQLRVPRNPGAAWAQAWGLVRGWPRPRPGLGSRLGPTPGTCGRDADRARLGCWGGEARVDA